MKAKVIIALLSVLVGAALGFPAGMNVERGAPVLSNPFAERSEREKLMGRLNEQTEKALNATRDGARKALDTTREKLHEATRPSGGE